MIYKTKIQLFLNAYRVGLFYKIVINHRLPHTHVRRYRGAVYADNGNFNRCIKLWMYALELQQSSLEPLYHLTLSSLLSFCELFNFLLVGLLL